MLLKLHHRSCIINAFCLFLGGIQSTTIAHSIQEKVYLIYKDGTTLYGLLIMYSCAVECSLFTKYKAQL